MKFNIFEVGIFSFNSYVYYLTRGSIASTRAFNLLTCDFNLLTRAFNLATRASSLRTHGFELITHGFELVTRGFELVTRGIELVTRNSCFPLHSNCQLAYVQHVRKKTQINLLTYYFIMASQSTGQI